MSSSDASRAAAENRIVSQATSIAAWVGEGKTITATGLPRRSDIPAVAWAVGVEICGRVRSIAYVKAIHHPWTVAQATGMITMGTTRAVAVADFGKDPLEVWLLGLEGVLRAESTDPSHQGVAVAGSAVLTVLAEGRSRGRLKLEHAVLALLHSLSGERIYGYLFWVGPMYVALSVLAEFGAVDDQLRLTPLGRRAESHMKACLPAWISQSGRARAAQSPGRLV